MRMFKIEEVGQVLQRIYDSEINCRVSSFWDGGFDFAVGDTMNGWENHNTDSLLQACKEIENYDNCRLEHELSVLAFAVAEAYPQSKFAQWYQGNDEAPQTPS